MRHVLACRLDNDGDVLLTGPAIRAIGHGADRVTMLCSARAEAAARLLPGLDEVVTFEAPWIVADPAPVEPEEIASLVDRIRALAVSEAIVFTSFHQSPLPLALLLRLAGVPRVSAISEDYPGSLLDVRHRLTDDVHEAQRNLSLAEAAGYPLAEDDDDRLRIQLPAGPGSLTDALRDDLRVLSAKPFLVVHPGASVPARALPEALVEPLVLRLVEEGWTVALSGGAAEADTAVGKARSQPGVVDLRGRTSLPDLAQILAQAEALIVGNTGPAHLAAAVATPVVSVFAPTVPAARWHPWKVPHVVLGHQDIGCAGCRARACPLQIQACVASVVPDEVVYAIHSLRQLAVAS